jgi:hypothetical protein
LAGIVLHLPPTSFAVAMHVADISGAIDMSAGRMAL